VAVARRRLGDIAHIYVGLPTKESDTRQVGRSGNVLTVRALTGIDIDANALSIVDFDGRDVKRYRVAAGDVLLSSRSTSLKIAIVPREFDEVIINATLLGVRCLPTLEPLLLIAWLNHPEGQAALESVSQSATVQMNITMAGLSKLEVPVPPMDEQKRIVELLEAADEAYTAAIKAAEDRRRLARQIVIAQLQRFALE
jgi:restriction endonuclease S subunit